MKSERPSSPGLRGAAWVALVVPLLAIGGLAPVDSDTARESVASAISVLNVDADSGAPLAGWTIELYAGPGCAGAPLQAAVTDDEGRLAFPDLPAGAYSVREVLQPGYDSVSPPCRDVTLAAPVQVTGDVGAAAYPPGGEDIHTGGACLVFQLGSQPADFATLNGPLVIQRSDPGDANRNGLADVQIRIVSMTLGGNSTVYGPITLRRLGTAGARADGVELPAAPQAPPWVHRADYLIVDNGVVAKNGVAFSFGGHNDVGCVTDTRRWGPDGAAGSWTDLAPLPEVLDAPRGALVDGKIYVPGGWDCDGEPVAELYIYDIAAGTWSSGAPPPSGRAAYGLAALGGRVYRIGGCSDAACTPTADVDIYDITAGTWSSGLSYPIAIAWQACGAIAGQIYCAGGYDGVNATHKAYRYTPPPVQSWEDQGMIDLCRPWWAMGAGDNAIDAGGIQSLYVYGGVVDGFDDVTDLAVHWDRATNSWYYFEPLNFAVYRQGGGSANSPLGNQYSVGGLLPSNPPSVGFAREAPMGGYYVQHYPTIPSFTSLCAGPPSVIPLDGLIEELRPAIPFPASGWWDLLFELEVGPLDAGSRSAGTVRNTSPLQAQGTIGAVPMNGEMFTYRGGPSPATQLPVYNAAGLVAGYVRHLSLVTMAAGDVLVAFTNRETGETSHLVYLPLVHR
ncbi:MAG: hypothetical protein JXM73_24620 [Anaerolineae bacterium]|nr:hypothetical protein [Anaerolineae bacterium]